ncbi:hypothetical protein EG830_15700 [bacterium]|nr:hypothetical protein [bacterium]
MNILAEKEHVKHAIKWISEHLEDNPSRSINNLVDKAIFEFDLSPADAEFITRFFHDRTVKG